MIQVLLLSILAMFSVSFAQAADDVEFRQSGDFRVRYESWLNPTAIKDAKDSNSDITHRLKYSLNIRKGEHVAGFVTFLHRASWGNDSVTNNSDNGTPDAVGRDNVVLINRAWGWWKATDSLSVKAGRLGIDLADGAIFSENDYEQVPMAHDGILLTWDLEITKVNIFAIKTDKFAQALATDSVPVTSDPEQNKYALSFDFKNMPEMIKTANIHFVQTVGYETKTQPKVNTRRGGLVVEGEWFGLLYKLTGAFVSGNLSGGAPGAIDKTVTTNMGDLLVGYQNPDWLTMKVSLGYHRDSGANSATGDTVGNYNFETLYYDIHDYGGLMDVWRWGNLSYADLNLSVSPFEDIELGLGVWNFRRTEVGPNSGAGQLNGVNVASMPGAHYTNLTANPSEADLGTEFDLWINRSFEGGFKISARGGAYMPGDALKKQTVTVPQGFPPGLNPQDQTIYDMFLQGTMTF